MEEIHLDPRLVLWLERYARDFFDGDTEDAVVHILSGFRASVEHERGLGYDPGPDPGLTDPWANLVANRPPSIWGTPQERSIADALDQLRSVVRSPKDRALVDELTKQMGYVRYDLSDALPEAEIPSYTCPKCGTRTIEKTDVREKYCPNCHQFEDLLLWVAGDSDPEPAD